MPRSPLPPVIPLMPLQTAGPTRAPTARGGQAPAPLDRAAFGARFRARFQDSRFDAARDEIATLEQIAWDNYQEGRKAPHTRAAGAGFADPQYALSVDWLATRQRLRLAQRQQRDAASPTRVLVISASARNDGTCPGENAKSWRLAQTALHTLRRHKVHGELLDLSRLTSEPDLHIHPCKGCVSSAMPLCHWPCSCYPNHALGQVNDAMADIYEAWVACHGVLIITPTYWYQSTSPLKLMIDRLVCADGGNPDPTSTQGKDLARAKALERRGWDYPKHLADRVYGVVVHGDVAGIEGHRRNLCDWLEWMGLVSAGSSAKLDRYVGYFKPYADSHADLDADQDLVQEVRNAAIAVARGAIRQRDDGLRPADADVNWPRPK